MTETPSGGFWGTSAKALATGLATLTGNLFLIVGSLFFGSLAILTGWIPPRGNNVFRCARLWSRGLLFFSGVRLEVTKEAELDPQGNYVFMANHQSLFDIPALIATLPVQTRFLAKQNLFRIPIFGWALSVGGFIPIDRKNRSRARESFTAAVQRLQSGVSILVFPEETRSIDGRLLPFRRGGFLLALKSGHPIVPVGLQGTRSVQSKRSLKVRPGLVTVAYGRPIQMDDRTLRSKDELTQEVEVGVAQLAAMESDEDAVRL